MTMSKVTPDSGRQMKSPQTKSGRGAPSSTERVRQTGVGTAISRRRRALARGLDHGPRRVERHHARADVTRRQFADRLARAAARIENHSRRDPDVIEA